MSHAAIADQIAEMRRKSAAANPNAARSPYSQEQAALAARGVPDEVIALGSHLADVELVDADGAATSLYAATGGRTAVLVFYRGAWCPFCNIALRAYQSELVPQLRERGSALIAVSPQSPDGTMTMQEKNSLTFSVLSDGGNVLARAVGIVTTPSPAVREASLARGMDIALTNADGTPQIPMPTALILGEDHRVRWIDVHPDYTTRSEPAEILAALDGLGEG